VKWISEFNEMIIYFSNATKLSLTRSYSGLSILFFSNFFKLAIARYENLDPAQWATN